MEQTAEIFVTVYIKLFFLLTPFFAVTVFLALTRGMERRRQRGVAARTTVTVLITSGVLYFFGLRIFDLLGFTLDAFRVGAGALLFLSAVSLVRGKSGPNEDEIEGDFAVVPLAIPFIVGPATIGTLMVLGAELTGAARLAGLAALLSANLTVGALLFGARIIDRFIGPIGLGILMKLTGLVLSALSAQLVLSGIKGFLG